MTDGVCRLGTIGGVGLLLISGSLIVALLTFLRAAGHRMLRWSLAIGGIIGLLLVCGLGGLVLAGCAVG
ncbi:MAG: hypothetical protein ACHQZR_00415 [Candidatus Limnocylindrales bacterium]